MADKEDKNSVTDIILSIISDILWVLAIIFTFSE